MPEDGSLWGVVLEKAFSKLYGTYELIEGGAPDEAIMAMVGSPYRRSFHSETSADELYATIEKAFKTGRAMGTAGTPRSAGGDTDSNEVGIA